MAYTEEQVAAHKAAVCELITSGKSLREICEPDDMPDRATVNRWLSEDPDFCNQYARAREQQADFYADEIIEIADSEKDAAKARNRIDARKWKASKLNAKKYGDKLDLNHSGSITTMSEDQVDARLAQLLGKAGSLTAIGAKGSDSSNEPA